MNERFTIKNFRIFDSEGADFEMAPITVLTGCNSSGKSSLVKAQLLLSNVLKQIEGEDHQPDFRKLPQVKLNLSNKNYQLGNFDNVCHTKEGDGRIVFVYGMKSMLLAEDVEVEMGFVANPKDTANRAWFNDITMRKASGEIIWRAGVDDIRNLKEEEVHPIAVLENFKKYSWAELALTVKENIENAHVESPLFALKEFGSGVPKRKEMGVTDQEMSCFKKIHKPSYKIGSIGYDCTNVYANKAFGLLRYYKTGLLYTDYELRALENLPKDQLVDLLVQKKKVHSVWINSIVDFMIEEIKASEAKTFEEYLVYKQNQELKNKFLDIVIEDDNKSWICLGEGYYLDDTDRAIADTMEGDERWKYEIEHHKPSSKRPISKELFEKGGLEHIFDILLRLFAAKRYALNSHPISTTEMDLKDVDFTQYEKQRERDSFRNGYPKEYNEAYEFFKEYFDKVRQELLHPNFWKRTAYVSSTRMDVRRLYELGDNRDKIGQTLTEYFNVQTLDRTIQEKDELVYGITSSKREENAFLNHWVREFGIGHAVHFRLDEDGVGVKILLQKHEKDKTLSLLANEGYGITQLLSLLIEVEIAILRHRNIVDEWIEALLMYWTKNINEDDAYYICDSEKSCFTTIYIEEPEIHLHPRFQSKLADMMMDACKNNYVRFVVETHSEYLVRKLQTLVADKQLGTQDVVVHYVYDQEDANGGRYAKSDTIHVKEDGSLTAPFGPGFYDEADNLSMDLLKIKAYGKL